MVDVALIATMAVSLVFFGTLTGVLVAVFRVLERDEYTTTGRRKLARGSFYCGAVLALTALVSLATTFVLDFGPVLGMDPLLLGVGTVAAAGVPLIVGLVLGIDEDALE